VDTHAAVNAQAFNPDGAVFVSYRQSDGSDLADQVAWTLRGCGVPVWRDKEDLLPGDFAERISQAFDEGISAAVLVITPDIKNSPVMKNIEVPRLLELHRLEPRFSLAVLNAVKKDHGGLDYAMPESLLDLQDTRLQETKQYEPSDDGIASLAVEMARRRVIEFSRAAHTTLPINIQTRSTPQATDAQQGLVIRLRPASDAARVPPLDAYQNVRTFFSACPQLVAASGATEIEITGGAHLSIGFGLGVAFPRVRHIPVTIVDGAGRWSSNPETVAAEVSLQLEATDVSPGTGRLAVYVDAAEHFGDPSAFELWMEQNRLAVNRRLVVRGPGGRLDATSGQRLAEQIEGAIRDNALPLGHGRVDLFLRVSFPVAVLLGRLLNTLTITTYEWDNATPPARYVPSAIYEYGTNPLSRIL